MATNDSTLNVQINATDNLTGAVKSAQSSIIRFVGAVSSAIVSLKALSFPIESSADFERALADVAKTSGFTKLEMDGLSESLIRMSKNMSLTALELANIAATAGQLGLGGKGVKAIEEFTESVARATVTFGLGEDQVSSYAAQLLQIFNIPTDKVENLFSQINELSNNSVASADNLLNVMRRVGSIAGLTAQEVGALAASTADFGVSSEVAGTTLVKFFSNMETKASDFARVLNITTQEWANSVANAPLDAFKRVTTALDELDAQSRSSAILDLFGSGRIFSLAAKFVNDAGNQFEVLNKNIQFSNDAFRSGTSSIDEYEKVVVTFNEQLKITQNSFKALAIESGEALLPVLKDIAKELQNFLDSDAAREAFDNAVASIGSLVTGIRDGIKILSEYSVVWDNLVAVLKIFIGLSVAKALLGVADRIGASIVRVSSLAAGWGTATKAMSDYYKQSLTYQTKVAASRVKDAGPVVAGSAKGKAAADAAKKTTEAGRQQVALLSRQIAEEKRLLEVQTQRIAQIKSAQGPLSAAQQEKIKGITQEISARQANLAVLERTERAALKTINKSALASAKLSGESFRSARAMGVEKAASDALVASQTRLAGVKAKLGAAAAAATTGIKAFGAALRLTGSLLSKVLLGPVGTIASLFFIFKDEIVSFFGFTVDSADKAAKAATKRLEKQAKEYADRLEAAFTKAAESFKASLVDGETRDTFTTTPTTNLEEIRDTQGLAAYQKALDETGVKAEQLNDIVLGGEVFIARQASAVAAATVEYNNLTEEIERLAKRQKGLEDLSRQGKTLDPLERQLVGQLPDLAEQERLLKESRDVIEKQIAEAEKLQAEREKAQVSLREQERDNIARIVSQFNESDASLVEIEQKRLQLIEDLVKTQEAIDAAKKAATGEDSDGGEKQTLREANALRALETRSANLNLQLKAQLKLRKQLNAVADTASLGRRAKLEEANARQLVIFEQEIAKARKEGLLGTAVQERNANLNRLIAAEQTLQATQRVQIAFNAMSGSLVGAIERAQSAYNNITSSNNAAAKGVRELKRELDSLLTKQQETAADREAFAAEDTPAKQAFELEKSYYERLIRLREQSGDTTGVARAQEDLSGLEERRRLEIESTKDLIQKERLEENLLSLRNQSYDAIKKLEDISKVDVDDLIADIPNKTFDELKELQKLVDFDLVVEAPRVDGVEGAVFATKELTKEQKEQLRVQLELKNLTTTEKLREGLQKAGQDAGELTKELIAITGEQQQNPLSGLYDAPLYTVEQRQSLIDQAVAIAKDINTAVSASISSGNEQAGNANKFLGDISKPLTAQITALNGDIKELIRQTGLTGEQYQGVVSALQNAYDAQSGSVDPSAYAEIAKQAKANADLLNQFIKGNKEAELTLNALTLARGQAAAPIPDAQLEGTYQNLEKFIKAYELLVELRNKLSTDLSKAADDKARVSVDVIITQEEIEAEVKKYNESAKEPVSLKAVLELDTDTALDRLNEFGKALEKLSANITVESSGVVPKEAATGGYIRGPGTSTSDSIPALLSDKEYVVRASAVKNIGVGFLEYINTHKPKLDEKFLEMLRRMGKLPKFATGGLVTVNPAAAMSGQNIVRELNKLKVPKFATGGLANAKTSTQAAAQRDVVDLNFNIGGNAYPVSGDRQVVQGLASALAAMSRGA